MSSLDNRRLCSARISDRKEIRCIIHDPHEALPLDQMSRFYVYVAIPATTDDNISYWVVLHTIAVTWGAAVYCRSSTEGLNFPIRGSHSLPRIRSPDTVQLADDDGIMLPSTLQQIQQSSYSEINQIKGRLIQLAQAKFLKRKIQYFVAEHYVSRFRLNNEFRNVFLDGLREEKDFIIREMYFTKTGDSERNNENYKTRWTELMSVTKFRC